MEKDQLRNFHECLAVMENLYDSVNGEDFYRFIFPNNENAGEMHTDFSHPNAIYLYQDEQDHGTERRLRRRIMLNDTWASDYMEYVEANPMTLCSGLTYHSRSNKLEYAQTMNALIFDLDGVGERELRSVLQRVGAPASTLRSIPKPTFIVLSGRGLHLYYVFDEPIALYPNIKLQLKSLKYDLTFRIWDYKGTSQIESIQYQSIGQGFRMVGSINSKYGNTVTAFRVGDRVSLAMLNEYASENNRVDVNRPYRPSKIDRAAAAELYPEWYQRVVVEGNKRLKKWNIGYRKRKQVKDYALYEWWLRQMPKIRGGHRYFFLMCVVIYACKCDVPKEKLKEDLQSCFEQLRLYQHENELTQTDVDSALECYSRDYYNFTIDDIEQLTDIRIERNKRNGRKQEQHLIVMRAVQNALNPNWRNTDGRPSNEKRVSEWCEKHPHGTRQECAADLGITERTVRRWWPQDSCWLVVYEWRLRNPDGRKAACIRDTGLSKPTVYKWWDYDPCSVDDQIEDLDEFEEVIVPEGGFDPEWHTELPKYYVVDGAPDMFDRMMAYANAGVRSVEILTREEYEYLMKKENERLQEEAKGLVFAESEVTEELKEQAAKRGVKLNIVSDEQYQAELVKRWLDSMSDDTDNKP